MSATAATKRTVGWGVVAIAAVFAGTFVAYGFAVFNAVGIALSWVAFSLVVLLPIAVPLVLWRRGRTTWAVVVVVFEVVAVAGVLAAAWSLQGINGYRGGFSVGP